MARGLKLGCSYKRSTLIVCSINIVVALYVLRSLYASLYLYTNSDFDKVVKYTPDQVKNMEESIRIRRAKEPVELVDSILQAQKCCGIIHAQEGSPEIQSQLNFGNRVVEVGMTRNSPSQCVSPFAEEVRALPLISTSFLAKFHRFGPEIVIFAILGKFLFCNNF